MELSGELGLFPLRIEIYTRMMKYLFHLGFLLNEGNSLIRDAIAECNKMIVRKQTCWLTSILHLLNMIKIDVKDQTLTTLDQHAVISTLKETLESRFVNEFFTVMKDFNKLQLYSNLKVLRRKIICQRSNFTNTGQQSLNFAFLHTPSLLKLGDGNPLRKIKAFVQFV